MRFEFRHVALVLERVAHAGSRTDDLLEGAGLCPDDATAQAVVGPVARIEALLTEARRRTGLPSFGLDLASHVPRGRFSWLEYAMRASPSVDDALRLLARYSALINRDAGYVYAVGEHDCTLAYETPRLTGGLGPQLNEFTIALVLAKVIEASGGGWTPTRAWFAHAAPTSDAVLGHLGCPVSFGNTTSGISIAPAIGRIALPAHDPSLHALMLTRLDELMPSPESSRSVSARVRSEILIRIGRDSIEIVDVARAMGMSSRTLQRDLASEETTFGDLVEKARRGLAETLLVRDDLSIGQVAALLGYADIKGFDRAFHRWTGALPTEWRACSRTR